MTPKEAKDLINRITNLSEEQEHAVGERFIKELGLKRNRQGRIGSPGRDKTDKGLFRMMREFVLTAADDVTISFTHHVDLNERGIYRMHVSNPQGETVFNANNQDPEENGEFWLVKDGFMKNIDDMAGLERYLKEMSIIPENSILIDND